MGPVRRVPRSVTAAVAMLLVVAASTIPTVSTHAAGPTRPPDGAIRAARNAWDRPTGDDPDRLIVTFRGGTSTLSRHSTLDAVGAAEISTRLPNVRMAVVRAKHGTGAKTLASLRADRRVERVSV